jgi:Phage integrase family
VARYSVQSRPALRVQRAAEGLEQTLAAFMTQHLRPGMTPDAAFIRDLLSVLGRAGVAFPPVIGGTLRTLMILDGTLRTLAPGFDTATESETVARRFAGKQLTPQSLRDAATSELLTMLPMLRKLPPRAVLDPETVIVLRAHRGRQGRQFAKAGIAPRSWVFAHEDGEPLAPSHLTHTFNDLVEETGLPPVRLHDLRHGAATLMLLAGEELKTIADLLGHSSVVLTADTYLSVAVELGLKAAAAAARLALKAGKSPPAGGSGRRRSAPVLAEITA